MNKKTNDDGCIRQKRGKLQSDTLIRRGAALVQNSHGPGGHAHVRPPLGNIKVSRLWVATPESDHDVDIGLKLFRDRRPRREHTSIGVSVIFHLTSEHLM